jgi:hypothetical protein
VAELKHRKWKAHFWYNDNEGDIDLSAEMNKSIESLARKRPTGMVTLAEVTKLVEKHYHHHQQKIEAQAQAGYFCPGFDGYLENFTEELRADWQSKVKFG